MAEAIRSGTVKAYCSELALTEMMYVICRRKNWREAIQKKNDLVSSNLVSIEATSNLLAEAALTKCGRALSLQDCFTITLARILGCEALFAKPEEELSREMKRKHFEVPIGFLTG